jgi:hypothetical protein
METTMSDNNQVDTFQNVAHLAPSSIVERLDELGAEHLIPFPDVLSHGPARLDAKRHREDRLDYWRDLYADAADHPGEDVVSDAIHSLEDGYLSPEQIGSVVKHHARDRRVVIWTSPTLQDRLLLWMTFHAIRKSDIPVERVATAEPQISIPDEDDRYFPLRDLEINELVEGFDALIYPEQIYVQAGADLWETFASASPRQFAISVAHTEKFFPEIATLAEDVGRMFPTVDGEGAQTIQLSEFDANLLRQLEENVWKTPFEVLGGDWIEGFDFVGDLAIGARLHRWATAEADRSFVDVREADADAPLFERREYRLAEGGVEICADGFDAGAGVPVLEIGDTRVYAGPTPWVRVVEDKHWWFERFEPDEG